jgi:hypothetical protein
MLHHHAALIGEAGVAADEDIASNALPKDLHTQHIGNDLLCLLRRGKQHAHDKYVAKPRHTATKALECRCLLPHPINVWVHQCHIVIAGYAVAQGRQPFVNALHYHLLRQRVSDVLQLCKGQ